MNKTSDESYYSRVIEGGSWINSQAYARLSCRNSFGNLPDGRDDDLGFRVVVKGQPECRVRGGSWISSVECARPYYYHNPKSSTRNDFQGFRLKVIIDEHKNQ